MKKIAQLIMLFALGCFALGCSPAADDAGSDPVVNTTTSADDMTDASGDDTDTTGDDTDATGDDTDATGDDTEGDAS